MLARQSLARVAAARVPAAPAGNVRNMATLRELELRLKSVRNIEKITKVRVPHHQARQSNLSATLNSP
jgi:F-type H+-transporting ATPase subunit gamma